MGKNNYIKNSLPAITLMFLSPLIAEILPGSTRFSSIFVFPIEVLVWGGGTLLIRYFVKKMHLGWISIILLGLALSVAEEFLIQQTSVATMVIQIKGVTYARLMGINYVYLLWALIYETVFVVLIPILLTEIIFSERRKELWMGSRGLIITLLLFLPGSFMAWYSWTQIARPQVYHVPAFNPPLITVLIAIIIITSLIYSAKRLFGKNPSYTAHELILPEKRLLALLGFVWAVILYVIVLLAFGILPSFPPLIAIVIGLLLGASALFFIPRWANNKNWSVKYEYSLISGTIIGSMAAGFVGFIGAAPKDLYFKIIVNLVALILLILLGKRVNK